MISPHIKWCIGKCPGVCTIIFKTFTWYLIFFALSHSYLDCLGHYRFVFHFYAQTVH